jgi:hypothetical protein
MSRKDKLINTKKLQDLDSEEECSCTHVKQNPLSIRSKVYSPQIYERAYSPDSHKNKIMKLKVVKEYDLKDTLESLPKSRKDKRKKLKKQVKNKGEGRGSKTRGWSGASPQRGKERNELMEECGEGCFLDPENKKYPICPALRTGQKCKIDCRALTSAINRSAEWKHKDIEKLARTIRESKCEK